MDERFTNVYLVCTNITGKKQAGWLSSLTTAAISAPVLWLMQANTRDDKKKKKVLAAVLTRSYGKTKKHTQYF